MKLQLGLKHGTGFFDELIRMDEGSEWTHAFFLVDGSWILEAYPGVGVRKRQVGKGDLDDCVIFDIAGMTDVIAKAIITWGMTQLGKPYDWPGIEAFMSKHRDDSYDRWFCSKFFFEGLRLKGITALARITCGGVRPYELSLSTLFTEVAL